MKNNIHFLLYLAQFLEWEIFQTKVVKVPTHIWVWLASPAGLGFQWVKLVRVWSVTSRTLANYIYISESGSRVKLPEADSQARLVRVWAP
jgi:hypothetical protein